MSLTQDIDARFDKAFLAACEEIGCNPVDLLAVMFSESNCKASAANPHGGASGLIQFMPDTLVGLGWRQGPQAFRMLSASQQLPYVIAYYRPWTKDAGEWDSAGRLYQATFLPATLRTARDEGDTLCAKGGRLGFAYEANAIFDANGDGRITIGELTQAVRNAAKGKRWEEMLYRLGLKAEWKDDGHIMSVLEVQRALNSLLSDVRQAESDEPERLVEDGIDGPKTRAAVRWFQIGQGIQENGRADLATRSALEILTAKA